VEIFNWLVVSKNKECPHRASPHSFCNNVYLVEAVEIIKIKRLVHSSIVQNMLGNFVYVGQ
jgi:spore germination protein GerM